MNYNPRIRILLLAGALTAFAALLVVRLFYVQVMAGEKYTDLGEAQYLSQGRSLYDRGSIFFRTKDGGKIGAATLASGYVLAIDPRNIDNPEEVYSQLSRVTLLDEESFMTKARRARDPYEEVKNKIDDQSAALIRDLDLRGVRLYKERWRAYSAGTLAAHVLGFVGYTENDFGGRYGVERFYDDILSRKDGGTAANVFAYIFSGIGTLFAGSGEEQESDIVLTIEPRVQAHLEVLLRDVTESEDTERAGGIVIHPYTGEIIAAAAYPSFNPNNYGTEQTITVFQNPLVESVFEMGSIVKPLTIAAALDAGVLSEEDTYNDKGYVVIDGARIANYDGVGRGVVPVQEILNQSLNTGAVHAMQSLGRDLFRKYMLEFGFGERTLVDLPNESAGLIENLESSRSVEYATASFGQGVAVTPIQMVRALSALANGGYIVRPHVVASFDYAGLPDKKIHREEQRQVINGETSERITRMLVTVVDDALRGGAVKIPQYTIAAKTGTAQVSNPDGGYFEDKFLHSFFGYFPAFDPEFLVFLYVEDPQGGRFASETLTGPFMDMTTFLLNYYEVPPDRN